MSIKNKEYIDGVIPPQRRIGSSAFHTNSDKNRRHRIFPVPSRMAVFVLAVVLFLILALYTFDQNITNAFSYPETPETENASYGFLAKLSHFGSSAAASVGDFFLDIDVPSPRQISASVVGSIEGIFTDVVDTIASFFKKEPSPQKQVLPPPEEPSYKEERNALLEQLPEDSEIERIREDIEALKSASTEDKQGLVERIIERIQPVTEVTQKIVTLDDKRLKDIESKIADLFSRTDKQSNQSSGLFRMISLTNKIDNLSGVTISNATVSGVSGLTDSDIPDGITVSGYLPLSGGTLTGALTGTGATFSTITVTASTTFNGVEYLFPSSDGTSGQFLTTNGAGGLSWSTVASSPWTTSGNDLYYNTGNIGIGTTSPYAKLSVVGEMVSTYFTATSTTATSYFAGNLGVGTSTPAEQLSVAGRLFVGGTGTSTIENNLSVLGALRVGTSSLYMDSSGIQNLSGNLILQASGNNLGIASSSPGALLSVDGSAYIGTSTDSTLTVHAGRINYPIAATSTIAQSVNAFSIATSTSAYPMLSFDGLNGRIGLATSSPFGFLSLDAFQATTTPTFYVTGGLNQTANLFTFANASSTLFGLTPEGALSLTNASSTSSILTVTASSTNPLFDLVQTGSGDLLRIATSTSTTTPKALVLNNRGLLGLGTTTPEEHLDLWADNSGNARFTVASSTAEVSILASTARNALRIVQNSTGALLELLDGATSRLKVYLAGNIDSDYLVATYNLKIERQDAATVRVPVPSSNQKDAVILNINGKIRKITATTTASLTADLDTGSEAAGTDYYVYAVADDSSAATFTLKLSTSKTSPTGLTNYRLIGGFHNDPESNIIANSVYTLKDPQDRTYEGMTKVGNFWIDIYEASVWTAAGGAGTQIGQSSDNYDANCGGDDTGNGFGCYSASKYNVTPARYITWFQSQQACVLSGKRLPTNAEWQAAAANTDISECNTGGTGEDGYNDTTDPYATGKISGGGSSTLGCKSDHLTYDMVGNVWEWADDWFVAGTNYTNSGADGTSYTPWPTGYGTDATWNIGGRAYNGTAWVDGAPAASLRGGSWDFGSDAGVFALLLNAAPSNSGYDGGFRCAE